MTTFFPLPPPPPPAEPIQVALLQELRQTGQLAAMKAWLRHWATATAMTSGTRFSSRTPLSVRALNVYLAALSDVVVKQHRDSNRQYHHHRRNGRGGGGRSFSLLARNQPHHQQQQQDYRKSPSQQRQSSSSPLQQKNDIKTLSSSFSSQSNNASSIITIIVTATDALYEAVRLLRLPTGTLVVPFQDDNDYGDDQGDWYAGLPPPDSVSYATVLYAAAVAGQRMWSNTIWNHVMAIQENEKKDDGNDCDDSKRRLVRFDASVYNARLRMLLLRSGNPDDTDQEALVVWHIMQQRSVPPDAYTIDLLLLPLVRAHRTQELIHLVDTWILDSIGKETGNVDVVDDDDDQYSDHHYHQPQRISDAFAAFLQTLVQGGATNMARELLNRFVLGSSSSSVHAKENKEEPPTPLARIQRVTPMHFNIVLQAYREQATTSGAGRSTRRKAKKQPLVTNHSNTSLVLDDDKHGVVIGKDDDDESSLAQQQAWDLYDTMLGWREEDGRFGSTNQTGRVVRPDSYTVTIMMSLCRDSLELSHLIWNATRLQGPDTKRPTVSPVVLRSAVTNYGRLGDASSACWMLAQFRPNHLDTRTMNVLMGALAECARQESLRQQHVGGSPTTTVLQLESCVAAQVFSSHGLRDSISGHDLFPLCNNVTVWKASMRLLDYMEKSGSASDAATGKTAPNSQTFCLVAAAMQYAPAVTAKDSMALVRKAMALNVSGDGRFINSIFRSFSGDIESALRCWKTEIRPFCVKYENRPRTIPPSKNRTKGKNLLAAYHGLLFVVGQAQRPDIAVRLVYAMQKEGLEPTEMSLNCYKSGKSWRRGPANETTEGKRIPFFAPYESLLSVECMKYDKNDKRRSGERRVRIIV